MVITRKLIAVAVLSLVAVGPACAKKSSSSGSGSAKEDGEDEEDEDDVEDDGSTSTKQNTSSCLVDDDGECVEEGEKEKPESEFYTELVTPTALKACNDDGFVFIRCNNECSTTIKTPPKFKCDRAGVEAIFSFVQGAKEFLADHIDGKKYFIGQCGVTGASKPFVELVCLTKSDGICVGKDDLDSKGAEVLTQFLTTDASVKGMCAADPTDTP